MPAWERRADGVRLHVRLTPKGGRDALAGVVEDAAGRQHLAARVSAPPSGGAANAALVKLVARALGVPKSAVRLTAGAGSRIKTLDVEGDPAALAARLREIAG